MKIKMEGRSSVPEIEHHPINGKYRLKYGDGRGWETFDTLIEAQVKLDQWLDMRMHSMIRDLDALAKLKRKIAQEIAP